MNAPALLALILAALHGGATGPEEDIRVRISVLGLIRPQSVAIACGAELEMIATAGSGVSTRLLPGETLEINADDRFITMAVLGRLGERTILGQDVECRLRGADSDRPLEVNVKAPTEFNRRLVGELNISSRGGGLQLILEAPLEQVVGEVVAAELGGEASGETAAAMAVAVRSFIIALKGRHGDEGFDICDSTHCLLYRGADGAFGPRGLESLTTGRRAARKTLGIVLTDGKEVIPGYFHSCCGGNTATPGMVWAGSSYSDSFEPVECDFCASSPLASWVRRAGLGDVVKAVGLDYTPGRWKLEVARHAGSNYVAEIEITGPSGSTKFSGNRFRMLIGRALGWNVVRSNAYTVRLDGEVIVFQGRGSGHGVGLCQEGAKAAADGGRSWREIIRFYFPHCTMRMTSGASF